MFHIIATILSLSIIIRSSVSFLQPMERNRRRNEWKILFSSWNGEVVSNSPDGKIRGCRIQKVDGTLCEWVISIDGVEADLGKFSEAIYRKITSDAKKMRFQGFRPGTIPPHLIPTYIAYTMDECAREATLEAMAQNNIRPFEDARNNFKFETISIPPASGKKTPTSKNKSKSSSGDGVTNESSTSGTEEWRKFDSMKEAIDSGWKPGLSFSFTATNVNGQLLQDQNVVGSRALGAGGSSLDLNQIK